MMDDKERDDGDRKDDDGGWGPAIPIDKIKESHIPGRSIETPTTRRDEEPRPNIDRSRIVDEE